jgi:hypothetical protein
LQPIAFIILILVILSVIAAAIIIPLEFFVIRKQSLANPDAQPALQECQARVTCTNGGTNVVNQNVCSCICTNGFTGFDCSVAGATGCTTTSLSGDTNINNVTLGDSIPRLIQQAQNNFSIPLSATSILAKFNSGNLSCSAENALITFDGQSTRQGPASAEIIPPGSVNALNLVDGTELDIVIISIGIVATTTMTLKQQTAGPTIVKSPLVSPTVSINLGAGAAPQSTSITPVTTPRLTTTISPTSTRTITTTISTSAPQPTAVSFAVTEEILDFSRVAVLFVLQQETLAAAESAQILLQKFLTTASSGNKGSGGGVTFDQAKNVTLGNGNSIDLVHFLVDVGQGPTGGSSARRT